MPGEGEKNRPTQTMLRYTKWSSIWSAVQKATGRKQSKIKGKSEFGKHTISTNWNACGILYLWSWTHTASGSEKKLWLCLYGCSHSFILAIVFIFDFVRCQISKPLMWTVIIVEFHILINGFYYSFFGGVKILPKNFLIGNHLS